MRVALAVGVALLAGLSGWQALQIRSLNTQLELAQAVQKAESVQPGLYEGRSPEELIRSGAAVVRHAQPSAAEPMLTPEQEEMRRDAEARRERGRDIWLANMRDEVESFAIEENISVEDTEKLKAYTEDFMLTLTDFRRAIYEGDVSPEQGREEMKVFRAEHEERMTEILGHEGYTALQARVGAGAAKSAQ
ncbi:MAG: hypothetical protein KC912_08730 [Proteobacteria bacterium]|nr:hypothetical protein [Pseudomonadota bacterium]